MSCCENCGCKIFNGACVNCHEEIYIEEQYAELDLPVPKPIEDKAIEQRKQTEEQSK